MEDKPLEKIVDRSLKFDFYDLYMQAGDKALYESEDIVLAMCYYRLADLDWYSLYAEEPMTEVNLDESVRNEKMELHEEIVFYKQIAEGVANEIDLSKMRIIGIGSLYVKFCSWIKKVLLVRNCCVNLMGFGWNFQKL